MGGDSNGKSFRDLLKEYPRIKKLTKKVGIGAVFVLIGCRMLSFAWQSLSSIKAVDSNVMKIFFAWLRNILKLVLKVISNHAVVIGISVVLCIAIICIAIYFIKNSDNKSTERREKEFYKAFADLIQDSGVSEMKIRKKENGIEATIKRGNSAEKKNNGTEKRNTGESNIINFRIPTDSEVK